MKKLFVFHHLRSSRLPGLPKFMRKALRTTRGVIAIGAGVILLMVVPLIIWQLRSPSQRVEATWFDAGYGYRKKYPIANSSGSAQTDFQTQLTIDTATLITAGKMLANCNDMRFTDTNGKVLPYWVEPNTCNSASTLVWVKVPSVPTSGADIYFYYGNSSAISLSTTTPTFIRDMSSAAAAWPLDDTSATQSYARVINPALTLGKNIVLNGGFDSDTVWTKGTNVSITGGVAVYNAAPVGMYQLNMPLVIGKTYQVTFTISGYSAGNINARVGSTGLGTVRSANGTYTENIVCSGDTVLRLYTDTTFTGNIDNVSVQQLNIPASNDAPAQLLTDGDMEASGTSAWTSTNGATLSKQTTSPHGGSQVLRVAYGGVTANPQASQNVAMVGISYRITGWFRGDGTAIPRIVNGAGTTIATGTASTAWQYFDATGIGATNNGLYLRAVTAIAGYAEFDDLTVTQVSTPSLGYTIQLLADGDMEAVGTTAWIAGNSASISKDAVNFHNGTKSLQIARTTVNSPYVSQNILTAGQVYRVFGYARSDGTAIPAVSLGTGGNSFVGTTATSWQPFDFVAVDAAGLGFNLGSTATSGTPYVEFDDVSVSLDTGIRQGEISQDGALETWTSATDLTNWAETLAGTSTVNKEASVIHGGSFAARLDIDASNSIAAISQSTLALGKTYTVTFWAKSDAPTGVSMLVTGTATYLTQNLTGTYTQYSVTFVADNTGLVLKRNTATSHSIYIDDVSVTEVDPLVGSALNGVTQGAASGGHLLTGDTWNGIAGGLKIFSSDQNSVFNPNEGTISVWAKVANSGVWSGTPRWPIYLSADSNNSISIATTAVANEIQVQYIAGGVQENVNSTALGGTTNWFNITLTWSKSADQVKVYFNGTQVGTTQTGLGTWNGNLTASFIGSLSSGSAFAWIGMINDVRLYSRPLSAAEIADQYSASSDIQAYTTNNFQGHELLRKFNSNVTVSAPATEETTPGPVGSWSFDEGTGQTVHDSTSKANNGTLGANPSVSTDDPTWKTEDQCVSGKCLFFDGGDYVSLANRPLDDAATVFTISGWVKTSSATVQTVFGQYKISTGNESHHLYLNASGQLVYDEFLPSGGALTGTKTVNNGSWHHVALVRNGTTRTLYVDGVVDVSDNSAETYAGAATDAWLIGTQEAAGPSFLRYMNGNIDELKLYSYARTTAQVQADYNLGAEQLGKKNQQNFLSNGLVGYWKMDENTTAIADSSGNAQVTTATGGAMSPGEFGNSFDFNGTSSDYVTVTDSNSLDFTTQFTVAAWVKRDVDSGAFERVIAKDDNGTSYLWFYQISNTDNFQFGVTNGGSYITSSSTMAIGTWYHLVGTYDGSQPNPANRLKIYINGVQDLGTVSGTPPTSITTTTGNVQFGRLDAAGYAYNFNGKLDEVRFYNRTLSRADVQALYNWAPGPVGYWKFDDHTGTTAVDSSGNGNNGTWSGSGTQHWINGKVGSAGNFNGSNDLVTVTNPSNSILDMGNGNFTFSAWINPGNDTAVSRLVQKGNPFNASGTGYSVLYRGDQTPKILSVQFADGTNLCSLTSGTYGPLSGKWSFITVTFSRSGASTTGSFYLNGVLISSSSTSTCTGSYTSSANFMVPGTSGLAPLAEDEVSVYSYARSPSQILEDMNAGASGASSGPNVGVLPKPMAYYAFDEQQGQTVNNSGTGGSSLNGTLGATNAIFTDDPTWSTKSSCETNGCLSFNGANEVDLASQSSFSFTSDFTLSTWIKAAVGSNVGYFGLITKYTGGTGWDLGLQSGHLRMTTRGSSSIDTSIIGPDLRDGLWHHIATVNTPSAIKVYVDGKLVDTTVGTWTATTNSQVVQIGRRSDSGTMFTGSMDEVKMYNVALTDGQINLDMNAASSLNYGTTAAAEATQLSDGAGNPPVADWNFDEKTGTTANDISGNGNSGTLTNGPTWTQGKYGAAVNYDGVDDQIRYGTNVPTFQFGSGSFTLEGWVKYGGLTSGGNNTAPAIFGVGATTTTSRYSFDVHDNGSGTAGVGVFLIDDSGNSVDQVVGGSNTLGDQNWHHVAVSINRGAANLATVYVDGLAKGTASLAALTGTISPQGLAVSATQVHGTNSILKGKIDEIKIYNYVRTPAQVAYDYNRGGPVGYWQFDECQGATAYDASGNGNNGTINLGASPPIGTCTTSGTAWGNGAIGKYNSSLSFDGVDDSVTMLPKLYNQGTYSVSAWVKPAAFAANNTIYSEGRNLAGGFIWIYIRTGRFVELRVNDGTNTDQFDGTATLTAGQWAHVVITKNGSSAPTIYINGQNDPLSVNAVASNGTIPALDRASIGDLHRSADSDYFNGQIDDVRIYNYVLSNSQVNQLFNQGSSVRFGPTSGSP